MNKQDLTWGDAEQNCTRLFTTNEKKTVFGVVGTSGMLSVTLCIIAIAGVLRYKLYKEFAYRLGTYQVMASMLISITVMLATLSILNDTLPFQVLCAVTGFLLEYFMWVKLLFALCLIFHLFCLAVMLKNFQQLEVVYIILCFCVPLLFTWIPFIHRSYGLTESWCWIRDTECNGDRYYIGFIEQYVLWFAPLTVCIVISFIAIGIILFAFKRRYNRLSVRKESDSLLRDRMKGYILRVYFRKLIPLLMYPIVYFALFLIPLLLDTLDKNFVLSLVHLLCYASVGLFSCLVLVVHVLLVRRLKTWREYFFPDIDDSMALRSSVNAEKSTISY